MAIGLRGQLWVPATSGGSNQAVAVTFDKDNAAFSGMVSGDVIFVYVVSRNTSGTWSVTTTGGQTWTEEFDEVRTCSHALYTAVFNGTWTADPVFDQSGSINTIGGVMFVLSGADPTIWDVDPSGRTAADTNDQDFATFDTNTDGAWAIWGGFENDDNTCTVDNSAVALSGSGNIYWQNIPTGTTAWVIAIARKEIATAGAAGATTLNYSANDPGGKWSGAIKVLQPVSITGAALAITPSLPTGAIQHRLAGAALDLTPVLPTGTVGAAAQQVDGLALEVTPSLPIGSTQHRLTGAALSATPSLPTATLQHRIGGTALEATPSLPPGATRWQLGGTALEVTPSLPVASLQHRLAAPAIELTPSLPMGAVSAEGTEQLDGVALEVTPSLPPAGLQHRLSGAALELTPTLPVGSASQAGRLDGVALSITPALPAATLQHRLGGAAYTIVPVLPTGSTHFAVGGAALDLTPSLPAAGLAHQLGGVALSIMPVLPTGLAIEGGVGGPVVIVGEIRRTHTGGASIEEMAGAGTIRRAND